MTDWQLIETAPKDGSRVLIFYTPEDEPGFADVAVYRDLQWWIGNGFIHVRGLEPSHWMPLPDPPVGFV